MATVATRDTRVRWKNEEKATLIAEAKRLIAAKPMKPLAALEAAQRVLPRARRRTSLTTGNIGWFKRAIGQGAAFTLLGQAAPASDLCRRVLHPAYTARAREVSDFAAAHATRRDVQGEEVAFQGCRAALAGNGCANPAAIRLPSSEFLRRRKARSSAL